MVYDSWARIIIIIILACPATVTAFLWYRPPPPPSPCHVPPGRFEFSTEVPLPVDGARTEGIVYSFNFSLSLSFSLAPSKSLHSRSLTLSRSPSSLSDTHPISLALPFYSLVFITSRFIRRPQTGFTSVNVLVSF
uniref:Transmembrane protein n=1 Tax=Schizaphis graminum TaxID=13262 RepID=A0A2S2P673_SCHGA